MASTVISDTRVVGKGSSDAIRLMDGARVITRGVKRVAGAGLVMAALGIWALPGSSWAADLALIKLTLSLAMGFGGIALWHLGQPNLRPEVELDLIRREVRLVQVDGAHKTPLLRCRFQDLTHVEQVGGSVRMWDINGAFIAEVDLCDKATQITLTKALREAGKIV